MNSKQPKTPDKLLLVHQGALGDFLLAWPAMLLASQAFARADQYFLSPSERLLLAPPDVRAAEPALRDAALGLYDAEAWPTGMADTLVLWFGLGKPPTQTSFENLWFLPGIVDQGATPVRRAYMDGLTTRGIQAPADWDEIWPQAFRKITESCPEEKNIDLLIFPGAGHEAKQWPLVKFFELARRLQAQGKRIVFVLGPAELNRGMRVPNFPAKTLSSLPELLALLSSARAALGNDSGPMHLAGMLGLPGVALFGPSSARQWAPWGIHTLSLETACRPCTVTTAGLDCLRPACLEDLSVEMVWEKLAEIWP